MVSLPLWPTPKITAPLDETSQRPEFTKRRHSGKRKCNTSAGRVQRQCHPLDSRRVGNVARFLARCANDISRNKEAPGRKSGRALSGESRATWTRERRSTPRIMPVSWNEYFPSLFSMSNGEWRGDKAENELACSSFPGSWNNFCCPPERGKERKCRISYEERYLSSRFPVPTFYLPAAVDSSCSKLIAQKRSEHSSRAVPDPYQWR